MLIQPGTDLRPFIGNEVRGPDGLVGYGEFNVLEDLQTAACLHSAATGQHWEPVDVAAMDTFGLNTVLVTPLDSLDEDLQFNCNRWSLRARDGEHNVAVTATKFGGVSPAAAAGLSIRQPRQTISLSP